MKLQLRVVKGVATVPELVGAAVRARRDALSALGGAAPADQQLAVLDAVAAVFEKEGVSLARLGRSLPLAKQLAIHAEWVQRIPEPRGAVKRQRQDMTPEQLEQRKAPRRRPNHPRATNPPSHVFHPRPVAGRDRVQAKEDDEG